MGRILPFFFAVGILISSCLSTSRIKDGDTAYDRHQFALAAELYMEEYSEARTLLQQSEKAFLLGESFRRMNKMEQAVLWYRQAYELDAKAEHLFAYAKALKQNEQYESASRAFEELQRITGRVAEFRKEATVCKQAASWKADQRSQPYIVRPMKENTPEAEYAPFLLDEEHLLFTTDGVFSTGKDIYSWTGNRYSDLMIRNLRTQEILPWGEPVNTIHNEGAACLNTERNEIYFTRCVPLSGQDAHCSIYFSKNIAGVWTDPVPMPWTLADFNDGHPWISPNGKVLFFSSDRPNGQGGYDIWLSRKVNNTWEVPINMGRSINTPGEEKFPTLDKDTLYYSSDGKVGMGGLDIFKTYLLPGGKWAPPQNLKAPINSGGDDFSFVVDRFKKEAQPVVTSGYFSSSRKGGQGNDDLYRFEYRIRVKDEELEARKGQLFAAVKVLEPVYKVPKDPNSPVIDWIPLEGVTTGFIAFGDNTIRSVSNSNGLVIEEIPWDQVVRISGDKPGYFTEEMELDPIYAPSDGRDSTINVELRLLPMIKGVEIVLTDIYYDFDKWDIREDAKPSLDRLANILLSNPGLRIELSSHTDCRGEEDYNLELSQKRALSAVEYLVSQGISNTRLVARGYGESRPIVLCECDKCTEVEHQKNRRTSFKIIDGYSP